MPRTRLRVLRLLLLGLGLTVVSGGCSSEDKASREEEVLTTEDIGGPIDAELSTDEDPRGRRRSQSSAVLPPGFPAGLPLPAGVSLAESRPGGAGNGVVVFDSPKPAETLAVDWLSLLEAEGWIVNRPSELVISARRGEQAITATIFPSGSASRLRISY